MLHEGLKNRSPAAVDKSMTPPKGSVNNSPTRSAVGKVSSNRGPRKA